MKESHETTEQTLTLQPNQDARELALRAADGVEVSLLWHPRGDFVTVTVLDTRAARAFEVVLEDDESPLDAFHHPYAHAARRGIDVANDAPERTLERIA